VILFVALGLLVLPHQLLPVAVPSLVLAVLLIVVIRPVAVWASLPFSHFTSPERALLGFAGLRGAVPIVLGTFVLSSGIPRRVTIFNAVFFIVLASALIQGATLERFARRLGVTEEPAPEATGGTDGRSKLKIEFIVEAGHSIAGVMVKEVGLPRQVKIAVIKRDGSKLEPQADTVLRTGDRLAINTTESLYPDIEDVLERWRRRV
jgi:cell volume regulation protein A